MLLETDFSHLPLHSPMFGDDAVLGCDFVGKVVELGEGVTKYAVSDLVPSTVWREIKGLGAVATHTLANEKILFKVPSTLSPSAAATVPLAACTAWLALFSERCLNINRSSKDSALIWGGSSSVGQCAIQIASIYGLDVVTTCSPRIFDLVKSLGANHVYDYNVADISERIRRDIPNIKYVFDTIGNEQNSSGGVPDSVKRVDVIIRTAFLKVVTYKGHEWSKSQKDRDLGAELFDNIPTWIAEGNFRSNEVLPLKGLKAVPEGFQMHRDGKISGKKVVYEI
ncbi:hypothetical protein BJX62DRAFT_228492 [Aspergillus germanicus]